MLGKLLSWLSEGSLPWLLCVASLLAGYVHGRDTAGEEAKAQIAAIQTAHAEAVASAEKSARERLAKSAALADRLQADLVNKNQELDRERREFNRRLKDVSEAARRDCDGLGADWVRLYNEALSLVDRSGNETSTPGKPSDSSHSAGTSRAGVREDALTTPEDVLAHIRDYGGYCRSMEAAYSALIEYEKGKT